MVATDGHSRVLYCFEVIEGCNYGGLIPASVFRIQAQAVNPVKHKRFCKRRAIFRRHSPEHATQYFLMESQAESTPVGKAWGYEVNGLPLEPRLP